MAEPVTETKDENVNTGADVKTEPVKQDGPRVKEVHRLHHAVGGGHSDFESESDLLEFVKEATTVKSVKQPDGSRESVYSKNAHLVHGASHPDYPNLRYEKVTEIVFPEDDE